MRRSLSGREIAGDFGVMASSGRQSGDGLASAMAPDSLSRPARGTVILQRGRKVGHLQHAFGLERVEAIDAMLQLAHVAGPVVGIEGVEEFLARVRFASSRGGSRSSKVTHQQRNVLLALAQGRQARGKDVEAVKQVLGGARRPPLR